jgi:Tol biopolymer transport system component
MNNKIVLGVAAAALALGLGAQAVKPLPEVPSEQKAELITYLKAHEISPEDYVIEKFKTYDYVFIGEYHRIKHDVELIHSLIPRLYKAGIYNLGIEFGCYEDQDQVDALITGKTYSEDTARRLMFRWFCVWGYQEYMDIYRKAWELNQTLPAGAPKFRVVNLNYRPNWKLATEKMTDDLLKKVWWKGDPDPCLADVILKEFVAKGKKALIYSGSHHAFTRYHQPIVDFEKKQFIEFNMSRMGNLVLEKVPGKAFNIFLHSPWSTRESFDEHFYPAAGVIDRVMREFKGKRFGFDVVGTPFGKIKDPQTYYAWGDDDFRLEKFCDGYIYQKPFPEYEGCTVDSKFITLENLQEAIDTLPNPAARKSVKSVETFLDAMREDADMKRRFRDLEEGAAEFEKVYSESPAAWYEVAHNAARISSDGKWALYHHSFGRGIKLINLETGQDDPERLAAGMDRVSNAAFYMGNQFARLGERSGQKGWFLPGPDGLWLSSLPPDASPLWPPDGSAVAYFRRGHADMGLFVGDAQHQKPYPIEGSITGFVWSPDGKLIYALVWHEDGLTSLMRINGEAATAETLIKDLDAASWLSDLSISPDGRRLFMALARSTAPVAEARHEPNADRDLDIYELNLSTGARRAVVEAPGDDFAPSVANGFLYWMHNDIHDSVVAVPSSGGAARVVEDWAEIPYWSPDGKQISFTYGPWRLADWALNLEAGVVDVDVQARPQSKMRPFVTGYHEDFTPAWSPDGKWIAYHSHRSKTPVSSYDAVGSTDDIYLRRVSGGPSEEIRLTDFGWEDGVADWAPDSRKLVFDSMERGGAPGVYKPWIVTIDPTTGKPVSAERLPLPASIKSSITESWSPKGDEIALEEMTGDKGRILWVVSLDGKRAEKLVQYTSSTYGGLDWTPDGKTIVYSGLDGERQQIFAVSRSGGSPRRLTDDPAGLMHPQVSPDGRWIACTRMSQSKEIRRLKL